MSEIEFDWDETKAALNLGKHGVSFEEATSVFLDDNALLIADPEHSDTEDRYILLGLGYSLRVLVVVHAYIESEMRVRLISARKANRIEAHLYDQKRRP